MPSFFLKTENLSYYFFKLRKKEKSAAVCKICKGNRTSCALIFFAKERATLLSCPSSVRPQSFIAPTYILLVLFFFLCFCNLSPLVSSLSLKSHSQSKQATVLFCAFEGFAKHSEIRNELLIAIMQKKKKTYIAFWQNPYFSSSQQTT